MLPEMSSGITGVRPKANPRREDKCPERRHVDGLGCDLEAGHNGAHIKYEAAATIGWGWRRPR